MTLPLRLRSALILTLLAACLGASCALPPQGDAQVLWNGGDPIGWKMAGPGAFVVEEGALKATGGMGLFWYAAREFEDFTLELEWKVEEPSDNAGVFVRFPDPGGDPWVAVNQGYEIQICDTGGPESRTGAIYSFQASESVPTRPPGQWNHMRITVRGQEYLVEVNGREVTRFTGERGARGFIGIQNHDDESPVRFRRIRVTEL